MDIKLKFRHVLAWLISGVTFGIAFTFFKPIFVVLAFGLTAGLVILLFAKKEERRFIVGLYFTALAVRLIVTVFLVGSSFANPMREDNTGALSGDEHVFWRRANDISKFSLNNIRNGRVVTSFGKEQISFGINAVSIMSSLFYSVFGVSLFALKVLTCVLGALSAVAAYYLGKKLFNLKAAQISSILVSFYPSLIRWSTQVLKEPFIILFILIIFLALLYFNSKKWYFIFLIAVSFLALHSLQSLIAAILFFDLSVYLLLRLYFKKFSYLRMLALICGLSLFTVYVFYNDAMHNKVKAALVTVAFRQHGLSLAGKSGYSLYPYYYPDKKDPALSYDVHNRPPVFYLHILPPDEVIGTPQMYEGSLVKYKVFYGSFFISYILGMLYAMFSPFPWSISTGLQIQACPQMIFTYFLFPFAAIGVLLSIRYKFKESSIVLLFCFSILSLLALSEGNMGAVFRHRDWVTPFALIFGAGGLAKIFYPSYTFLPGKPEHK